MYYLTDISASVMNLFQGIPAGVHIGSYSGMRKAAKNQVKIMANLRKALKPNVKTDNQFDYEKLKQMYGSTIPLFNDPDQLIGTVVAPSRANEYLASETSGLMRNTRNILGTKGFSNKLEKKQFVMTEGIPSSNNIIANINLNGPIFNNNSNVLGNNLYDYINPSHVKSYLDELKELEIKALIININSPGGTVSATAELEQIIYEFKKNTDTKIYFYTKEILASGGYWVATTADKIFASYGSIIGSIGVSGPSWFYYNTPTSLSSGIFGQTIETKEGIEVFNQNAGEGKDLFNPFRRPRNCLLYTSPSPRD